VVGGFDQPVRRVAVLSVHSSPLAPPGVGDSGGMNVTIRALAGELARAGIASDLYTRAASPDDPPVVELQPGVRLLHLPAGPPAPVPKQTLPRYLCAFLCSLLRAGERYGPYDVLHSHYWVSGWVARLARERWDSPMVHSFHTLGRVKNLSLADGDQPEPPTRLAGEERVAAAADCLVAPTPVEARQLVELYGAAPARVRVVPYGVDRERFHPGDREAARAALGVTRRHVLAFVGRLQPLKAPDVAVLALAALVGQRPDLDVELLVIGGASGNGGGEPARLAKLAADAGVADRVRFLAAQPHDRLATVYRAADLVLMPSWSESFGLVALEAQACGTPVVAAEVGGLQHAVGDGTTGVLVASHQPEAWAGAVARLLSNPRRLAAMGAAAARFAGANGWDRTAARLLGIYGDLVQATREPFLELERTS
jgi:D-inositol-3-phosphate glycosyltransferase